MISMKKNLLLIIGLIICIAALAQGQGYKMRYYKYPKKVPEKYIFNPKDDYQKLKAESKPKGWKEQEFERYCEMMAFQKSNSFLSGEVYLGWDEMETYVNDVLKTTIGTKAAENGSIHAFPQRNSDFNAYCIHDGTFYVNIGLLADVTDEAGLATILGHEYAHYKKQHLKKSLLQKMRATTKRKRNRNDDLVLESLHSSREFEQQADSIGAALAAKAGYNLKSGIANFYQLRYMMEKEAAKSDENNSDDEDENKLAKQKDAKGDKVLSSHPDLKRRIKYFKRFVKTMNEENARKYIVSEEKFKALQTKAQIEVLSVLLEDFSYKTCTEKAFTYYLFNPDNDVLVYYLLEACRRAMIVHPDLYKKPFLTDDYSKEQYDDLEYGILANLDIIVPDSNHFKNIVATNFVVDTVSQIPFKTWQEAFDYFSKIATEHNIVESYLTMALAAQTKTERKNLIDKYLSFEKVKMKDFALALKEDNLLKSLETNTKDYMVTGNVKFIEDHRYGYHYKQLESLDKSKGYLDDLKNYMQKNFPEKELVQYSEMAQEDMAKAMKYRQAMLASLISFNLLNKADSGNDDNGDSSGDDDDDDDSDSKPAKKKSSIKKGDDDGDDDSDTKTPTKKTKTSTTTKKTKADEVEEFTDILSTDFSFASINKKKKTKKEVEKRVIKSDRDIQTFLLNPEIWSFFKKESIHSLETVTTTSFTDKTQLLGLHITKRENCGTTLACIYATPLILPIMEIVYRVGRGSIKNAYEITYYSFTPTDAKNKQWYYEETVHYKMYPAYFLNSYYNALNSKKNDTKDEKKSK
jgi:Zn-dependent protease with chaperone function